MKTSKIEIYPSTESSLNKVLFLVAILFLLKLFLFITGKFMMPVQVAGIWEGVMMNYFLFSLLKIGLFSTLLFLCVEFNPFSDLSWKTPNRVFFVVSIVIMAQLAALIADLLQLIVQQSIDLKSQLIYSFITIENNPEFVFQWSDLIFFLALFFLIIKTRKLSAKTFLTLTLGLAIAAKILFILLPAFERGDNFIIERIF